MSNTSEAFGIEINPLVGQDEIGNNPHKSNTRSISFSSGIALVPLNHSSGPQNTSSSIERFSKGVKTSITEMVKSNLESKQSKDITPKSVSTLLRFLPFLSPSWNGWDYPSTKVIRAFNIIKVLYIFFLIPYHITVATSPPVVINNPAYASYYLPYNVSDHGLEYMAGLLFISGWLSHATTKPGTTFIDLVKKKLLRLLPSYYIGAIPMTLLCIVYESLTGNLDNTLGGTTGVGIQFFLELLTLGSWNPALDFWTRNRPLWFISTLLTYHYCSPFYLPWIRSFKSANMLLLLILFYISARILIAYGTLSIFVLLYPTSYQIYGRIIHVWSGTQLFLPFIGSTLGEFASRIGKLKWSRNNIWRATDLCTLACISLSFFVLCPPVFTEEFAESLTGWYVNCLTQYSDLITWPLTLTAVYLYSHDFSTLTWVYFQYPRIFDDGFQFSYPLFLIHWPVILMLQYSGAITDDLAVSVVIVFGVALITSMFIDSYFIGPLEEIIIAYVDPPKAAAPLSPLVENTSQKARPSEAIRLSARVHKLEDDLNSKISIIATLPNPNDVDALSAKIDDLQVELTMKQQFIDDLDHRVLELEELLEYANRSTSRYTEHRESKFSAFSRTNPRQSYAVVSKEVIDQIPSQFRPFDDHPEASHLGTW